MHWKHLRKMVNDMEAAFIDTLISASIVSAVMLVGVLASAIYEKWLERNKK